MSTAPGLDVGQGPPLVILQGFALQPRTYRRLASLLEAEGWRVLVPSLFSEPGASWTAQRVLDRLLATFDDAGVDSATLLAHSFGGALALELAARHPDRVRELVFADTLAMSREWTLAAEALRPRHLWWMATPRVALDFAVTVATHPVCVARAGWWGFRHDRHDDITAVAAQPIPCHVLWASRDSLLWRSDGQAFARDLGASFSVVGWEHGPLDHDWIYRHPDLVVERLRALRLAAFPTGADPASPAEPARKAVSDTDREC